MDYLTLANSIADNQNTEVGCLIVDWVTGDVLATGYNVKFANKRNKHAEIMAISAYITLYHDHPNFDYINDPIDLYVSQSPCVFCYEVLRWFNINNVYYTRLDTNDARYYYNVLWSYHGPEIIPKYRLIPTEIISAENKMPYKRVLFYSDDIYITSVSYPPDIRYDLILHVPNKLLVEGNGNFTWREWILINALNIEVLSA